MSKENGQVTLSAVDFLQLAEIKRVARVDLEEAGLSGVVYVCDLSTSDQQRLFGGQDSIRTYGDGSREIAMPKDAASKMIGVCMVTDGQDGALFEEQFNKTDAGYISFPSDKLIYMNDLWRKELGNTKAVNDKIADLPNIVTNLIMKHVNELSGLKDEPIEEKKSN
jgi:hypothetical protein